MLHGSYMGSHVASGMRSALTSLAIALGLAMSCSPGGLPERLSLERRPCFGICSSYRLDVYADGRVLYEGPGWVNTMAGGEALPVHRDSTRLSRDQTLAIFRAFDQAWSRWRPNRFGYRQPACPDPVTDQPSVTLVRISAQARDTMDLYYGCQPLSERIDRAAAKIDSLVAVERWLGPGPRRRGIVAHACGRGIG